MGPKIETTCQKWRHQSWLKRRAEVKTQLPAQLAVHSATTVSSTARCECAAVHGPEQAADACDRRGSSCVLPAALYAVYAATSLRRRRPRSALRSSPAVYRQVHTHPHEHHRERHEDKHARATLCTALCCPTSQCAYIRMHTLSTLPLTLSSSAMAVASSPPTKSTGWVRNCKAQVHAQHETLAELPTIKHKVSVHTRQ